MTNLIAHWWMDGWRCVFMCVCTCIPNNRLLLCHKKGGILPFASNMDGPWGYEVKWGKSDKERQLLYDFARTSSIKVFEKWTNNTHRYWERVCGYQRRWQVERTKWIKRGSLMWWWMETRLWWWAHCSVFRNLIILLHTWNIQLQTYVTTENE